MLRRSAWVEPLGNEVQGLHARRTINTSVPVPQAHFIYSFLNSTIDRRYGYLPFTRNTTALKQVFRLVSLRAILGPGPLSVRVSPTPEGPGPRNSMFYLLTAHWPNETQPKTAWKASSFLWAADRLSLGTVEFNEPKGREQGTVVDGCLHRRSTQMSPLSYYYLFYY